MLRLSLLFVFLSSVIGDEAPPKEQYIDPEPGAPDPAAVVKQIKQTGEHEFQLGVIKFNKKSGEIRFPANINQTEVLLEYAIVNELTGKTHEALLTTPASPLYLAIVLKLMRFEESGRDIWQNFGEDGKPLGPMKVDEKGKIQILVEQEVEGKVKRFPVEDWIFNGRDKKSMGDGEWVHTGSEMYRGYFLAETDGSIAAIFRSNGALLNSFHDNSDSDEVWFPFTEKLPEMGAKVDVILVRREDKKK